MEPSDILDENGNLSIELGKGVSRRDAMKKIGAVGAAMGTVGMAGCQGDGGGTDTPDNGGGGGGGSADFEFSRHPAPAPPGWESDQTESGSGMNSDRRCVYVIQNVDNTFFVPMTCGYHDALNIFGYTGALRGPGADGTLQDQVNIIEEEIDGMNEGDIIISTILDTNTYNDAIQSALDNNIIFINGHSTPATNVPDGSSWNYGTQQEEFTYTDPVSGEDVPMIIPHVGIRDARGGVAMAVEMQDRLENQYPDQDEYTVFLVNDLPDNPAVSRRVDKSRASEGTAQRYYETQDNINIYEDSVFETPQPPQIETSRNDVVDTIQGEGVDAVVASAFWAAAGSGAARNEGALDEDMLICGFDLAGMVGSDGPIASGNVDFVMGQDPYTQGFLNVPLGWMWAERGIEMKDLEWGVSIFDQGNIEFATQRRKWSTLIDWQENNYDVLTY
jgi:ABC-type sugar transport system substrate-binding protein